MKKKNVLTMALSVSLVGVIAVGGTLAYLTSTTGPVENTFTASDGIKMTLDEAKIKDNGEVSMIQDPANPDNPEAKVEERTTSNTYNNIVPGVAYYKDPTVTMEEVPAGGAYVFVRIEGLTPNADQELNYTVTASSQENGTQFSGEGYSWQKVSTEPGQDGIYVYGELVENKVVPTIVSDPDALTDVFQYVTFNYDNEDATAESKVTFDKIKVAAYAIQAKGVDYSDSVQHDGALELATTELNNSPYFSEN